MVKIIILQQMHTEGSLNNLLENTKNERDLDKDIRAIFNAIAESQYTIAKILKAHKGVPVILENTPTLEYGKNKASDKHTKQIFPKGLPENFSDLSFIQKKFLTKHTGGVFAVHSHIIDKVHSDNAGNTLLSEEYLKNEGVVKIESAINQKREYNTLAEAKDLAKRTNSDTVIVAYGKEHPFDDVVECMLDDDVQLEFINTIKLDKKYQTVLSQNAAEHALHRPKVNCPELAANFKPNQPLLSSTTTPAENTNMYTAMFAAAALTGVLLYGLFSRKKNPILTPTPTMVEKKSDLSRRHARRKH